MVGILHNITLPTYLPHILDELSLREFTCSPGLDTKRLMYERTWKFINDQFYDGKNHSDTEVADIPTDQFDLIQAKPKKDMLFFSSYFIGS
jgi:hypothetical protein